MPRYSGLLKHFVIGERKNLVTLKRLMLEFMRVTLIRLLCWKGTQFAICKFLAEVRKVKDGGEYPGSTLYHLVVSILFFFFLHVHSTWAFFLFLANHLRIHSLTCNN